MKISKTTVRMAERRSIHLAVTPADEQYDGKPTVEICRLENGEPWDEFHALYQLTPRGMFFISSCFDGEEWPYWIPTEMALRDLLDTMADLMIPGKEKADE